VFKRFVGLITFLLSLVVCDLTGFEVVISVSGSAVTYRSVRELVRAYESRRIATKRSWRRVNLKDVDLDVIPEGFFDGAELWGLSIAGECKNLDKLGLNSEEVKFMGVDFADAGSVGGLTGVRHLIFRGNCRNVEAGKLGSENRVELIRFWEVDFGLLGKIGEVIKGLAESRAAGYGGVKTLIFRGSKNVEAGKFVRNDTVEKVRVAGWTGGNLGGVLGLFTKLWELVFFGVKDFSRVDLSRYVPVPPEEEEGPEKRKLRLVGGVRKVRFDLCDFGGFGRLLEELGSLEIVEFAGGNKNFGGLDFSGNHINIVNFLAKYGVEEILAALKSMPSVETVRLNDVSGVVEALSEFAGPSAANRSVSTVVLSGHIEGLLDNADRFLRCFAGLKELVVADATLKFDYELGSRRGESIPVESVEKLCFRSVEFEISKGTKAEVERFFDYWLKMFPGHSELELTRCEFKGFGDVIENLYVMGLLKDKGYKKEAARGEGFFVREPALAGEEEAGEVREPALAGEEEAGEVREPALAGEEEAGEEREPALAGEEEAPASGLWLRLKGLLGRIPGGFTWLTGWWAEKFGRTSKKPVVDE